MDLVIELPLFVELSKQNRLFSLFQGASLHPGAEFPVLILLMFCCQ